MEKAKYVRFFTINNVMNWSGHTLGQLRSIYAKAIVRDKYDEDEIEQLEWMLQSLWDAETQTWKDDPDALAVDPGDFVTIRDCCILRKDL